MVALHVTPRAAPTVVFSVICTWDVGLTAVVLTVSVVPAAGRATLPEAAVPQAAGEAPEAQTAAVMYLALVAVPVEFMAGAVVSSPARPLSTQLVPVMPVQVVSAPKLAGVPALTVRLTVYLVAPVTAAHVTVLKLAALMVPFCSAVLPTAPGMVVVPSPASASTV
jgi:hypothetical protein